MQAQMAAAATSVLPLPTSPCKRRFMDVSPDMSVRISSTARRCAPVGEKGSDSQNGEASAFFIGAPVEAAPWFFIRPMPSCKTRSSS